MKKTVFGRLSDGREVHQYTLTNRLGSVAQIIDYGATVTSLIVPDRNGVMQDVVLGCDSLQGYVDGTAYFGAIVGRYGNRIANGRFQLDGIWYQVSVNDGANHLHGGRIGFNKVLWNVEIPVGSSDPSIRLRYVSRDGEEGYPGTVVLQVTSFFFRACLALSGSFTIRRSMPKSAVSAIEMARMLTPALARTRVTSANRPALFSRKTEIC